MTQSQAHARMHTVYTTRTSHQFLRHARACQSAHALTRGACVCVLACMRACMRALGCAHKVTKTGTSPTFMPMHPSSHPRITLCSPTNIPFHIISIQFSVDYLHPVNQDGKTLPANTQQQGLVDFWRVRHLSETHTALGRGPVCSKILCHFQECPCSAP